MEGPSIDRTRLACKLCRLDAERGTIAIFRRPAPRKTDSTCRCLGRKPMPEQIDVTIGDAVARIAINRPEKKNALTAAMYAQLVTAFSQADADPAVRVIVIHGTDDCFTAGNDLKDFMSAPPRGDFSPPLQVLQLLPA